MDWHRVAHVFVRDGSLRDIYVLGTDAQDWQRVLDELIYSGNELTYEEDGEPVGLPKEIEPIFARRKEAATALFVNVGGVALACYFFTPTEIEFDLSPQEVTGQDRLDAVLGFMRRLSLITGKPAILTPESDEGSPIFRVIPGSDVAYLRDSDSGR